jgi:predicted acylesterase/phospholipase RssA
MFRSKISTTPLEKIALSCSGGGYRAAIFHLGTMAYLSHLNYKNRPLIENLEMISTVSGGTITGAVYAAQSAQGKSFKDIYHFIVGQLHQIDLVKEALILINRETSWPEPQKSRNLINAFALLYDQHFTHGFSIRDLNNGESPIRSVVFNATDFSHALNFRFRNAGSGHFGNAILRVPHDVATEVKLSDAIASSACFPGGFEPMLWPHDFRYEGAQAIEAFAATRTPVGLMDGGIYDNQGIDSILGYKSKTNTFFDLIIVSDVSSPDMTAFKPSRINNTLKWHQWTFDAWQKRIQWFSKYSIWILFSFVIFWTMLPVCWGYSHSVATGICLGIGIACLSIMLLCYYAKSFLSNLQKTITDNLQQTIPPFYWNQLSQLKWKTIPFGEMVPLLLDRSNSLKILLSEVFLKIVRRLNYHKLYRNNKYEFRRVSNLIKGLLGPQFKIVDTVDPADFTGNRVISKTLHQIAQDAAGFGTTLWFTEEEQLDAMLDKLVVAGQAGMCFHLLEYLTDLTSLPQNGFLDLPIETQQSIIQTLDQCRTDWVLFQNNPYFLHQLLMEN